MYTTTTPRHIPVPRAEIAPDQFGMDRFGSKETGHAVAPDVANHVLFNCPDYSFVYCQELYLKYAILWLKFGHPFMRLSLSCRATKALPALPSIFEPSV
ncbi:hypothetical protein AVEN_41019-1 [Araneus ventricosus]|uniref:Uncharacterized protein n=1 Tax=Araneus ventricosus TaxID=182803 RepID=A0A4Y2CJ43_ARAVE|nr:hypothetical protein AVEN_41019-1 [Araneus ventricosus]